MREWLAIWIAILVSACDSAPPPEPAPRSIGILVRAEDRAAIEGFATLLPSEAIAIRVRPDPVAALTESEDELTIALAREPLCVECYRLERPAESQVVVRGEGALALQYGFAHVLEQMGFRFFHPFRTHVPAELALPAALPTETIAPEMAERGLHLHVLHPIEAYFALWEPGEENVAAADRIFAWIVANRGNLVHWPGLDDIEVGAPAARWREHTRTLLDHAHRQGLHVGLGMQLFGSANLQRSFDLIDRSGDPATLIDTRLAIFEDLPFDAMSMSFGEFSGAEPATMIATLDLVYDAVQARWPGREFAASIHVGNSPDQRVTWMGEDIPYYFLATRANPGIVPWIHTVMYYDLFEDAGGAYEHDDFGEHRELLFDLMREGRAVAYYPETAYWVAFDNSVPTYLPLYVRTRFTDLARIREAARSGGFGELERHTVFSSGWEWGYWQNDVACLRMSHTLPSSYEALLEEMLAPYGAPGLEAAGAIADLADAQHRALIEQRLAAWYAGRDVTIDLGASRGIVAQPGRPSYVEITEMTPEARATFATFVVEPLAAFSAESALALERLRASGLDETDPFVAEIVDGMEIDVARAAFANAALRAVVLRADAGDPADALAELEAILAGAHEIVERRHAALHHPDGALLVATRRRTAGLYDYGYLREADTLCYWERERAQVRNLLLGEANEVPGCVL